MEQLAEIEDKIATEIVEIKKRGYSFQNTQYEDNYKLYRTAEEVNQAIPPETGPKSLKPI